MTDDDRATTGYIGVAAAAWNTRVMAPKSEPERQKIDLAAVRAQQRAEQSEAARKAARDVDPAVLLAAAVARPPATGNLAGCLHALGRGHGRTRGTPPLDLAQRYDEQLAALIQIADAAHFDALDLAMTWESGEAGGVAFRQVLETGDEVAIVALLVGQPAAFAAAVIGQRRAGEADNEVRSYAAAATELHERLDQRTNDLVVEINKFFEQARDERLRGPYERALELVDEWRVAASLFRWRLTPNAPYVAPSGSAMPLDCMWHEHEAAVALGEQRWAPPTDAPDAPKPDVRVQPMVSALIR